MTRALPRTAAMMIVPMTSALTTSGPTPTSTSAASAEDAFDRNRSPLFAKGRAAAGGGVVRSAIALSMFRAEHATPTSDTSALASTAAAPPQPPAPPPLAGGGSSLPPPDALSARRILFLHPHRADFHPFRLNLQRLPGIVTTNILDSQELGESQITGRDSSPKPQPIKVLEHESAIKNFCPYTAWRKTHRRSGPIFKKNPKFSKFILDVHLGSDVEFLAYQVAFQHTFLPRPKGAFAQCLAISRRRKHYRPAALQAEAAPAGLCPRATAPPRAHIPAPSPDRRPRGQKNGSERIEVKFLDAAGEQANSQFRGRSGFLRARAAHSFSLGSSHSFSLPPPYISSTILLILLHLPNTIVNVRWCESPC
ncbi:unnamed protein product [Nesidiocoris tenuis]|uniref:Uncharacterized protein n=1 Tax=Nesidiocoris tenuis TaxID=355587 RepID=A0A6H5HAV1_9HEMI|nr:unnamed protein product [Nesidiocoris tenuis]